MNIVKKVIRVLLVAVYVVIAAEVYIRVFSPLPLMPRYVSATDYGIRGNSPNAHYVHKTPDYRVEFNINSRGIRSDEEIPYEKPAGEKRVVFLGDSFTMGYGAKLDQTFHAQMASILKENDQPCRVINLGVSGHGNAEELLALRAEGLKYDPDLVVVAWHITDISDNVRSNLFRLKEGVLEPANKTYLPSVKVREKLNSYALYRWVSSSSHLYVFGRDTASRLVQGMMVTYRGGPPEPATEPSPTPETASSKPRTNAEKLTIALLTEIRREATASGATFLLLDIPQGSEAGGYRPGISEWPEIIGSGMPVCCPAEAFNKHLDELLVWRRSAFHYTPAGNRLVGETLAAAVLDNKLLEGGQ